MHARFEAHHMHTVHSGGTMEMGLPWRWAKNDAFAAHMARIGLGSILSILGVSLGSSMEIDGFPWYYHGGGRNAGNGDSHADPIDLESQVVQRPMTLGGCL